MKNPEQNLPFLHFSKPHIYEVMHASDVKKLFFRANYSERSKSRLNDLTPGGEYQIPTN